MASRKKPGGKAQQPLIDLLPGLLVSSLAKAEDFIVTFETDPDTGRRAVHVLTGRFVSPCMLRKLQGLAISQEDEGSRMLTRSWPEISGGSRRRAG